MNELNKQIRSLELLILSRRQEEYKIRRHIGYLKKGHRDYRRELESLRDWLYEGRVLQIELDFKKRELEIVKTMMEKELFP